MTTTAALIALVVVALARVVQATPWRMTSWSRSPIGRRVLGVVVGVGLSLAYYWLAGRGFEIMTLGLAVAAGFYVAGERGIVSWAINVGTAIWALWRPRKRP